jgi:hypothetical protein
MVNPTCHNLFRKLQILTYNQEYEQIKEAVLYNETNVEDYQY